MKIVTLEGYASNNANTSFVTFFMLNVRTLLSVRIKSFDKKFLTDGHVEQQKTSFRWTKGLLDVLGFYLQQLVIIMDQ